MGGFLLEMGCFIFSIPVSPKIQHPLREGEVSFLRKVVLRYNRFIPYYYLPKIKASPIMSKIIFKRNMNIGDLSAENDDEFLEQCFIETHEYEEISNFNKNKMILLGRTGSGKTALLKKLERTSEVFIEINPSTFALEYINNVPFVAKLKEENVNLEAFYKFLWLHEIISKIIKNYFPGDSLSGASLVHFFLNNNQDKKKIQMFKDYLDQYEGLWFQQDFPEKVTQEIQTNLSAKLKFPEMGELTSGISEKEKKEIQSQTTQYVQQEQIKQLLNIIDLLKGYFKNNQQKRITVAIDNLDENWIDDESKYKLINALLTSIRSFTDTPPLKIIIALRADLLEKTCLVNNRQDEKDGSFMVKLDWTKQMIADLLNKRIQYLFKHQYTKQNVRLEEVFSCKINNVEATDFIIGRTMMRPRDAISFVNICIRTADNSPVITAEHILKAEIEFRMDRLTALRQEWHNIYPELELYIKSIYEIGNEFNYADLINNYNKIEKVLFKGNGDDLLIIKFLDGKLDPESKIVELVKILFRVGIVGIRHKEQDFQYCTPHRPKLVELDFNEDLLIAIHPLFKKA